MRAKECTITCRDSRHDHCNRGVQTQDLQVPSTGPPHALQTRTCMLTLARAMSEMSLEPFRATTLFLERPAPDEPGCWVLCRRCTNERCILPPPALGREWALRIEEGAGTAYVHQSSWTDDSAAEADDSGTEWVQDVLNYNVYVDSIALPGAQPRRVACHRVSGQRLSYDDYLSQNEEADVCLRVGAAGIETPLLRVAVFRALEGCCLWWCLARARARRALCCPQRAPSNVTDVDLWQARGVRAAASAAHVI